VRLPAQSILFLRARTAGGIGVRRHRAHDWSKFAQNVADEAKAIEALESVLRRAGPGAQGDGTSDGADESAQTRG